MRDLHQQSCEPCRGNVSLASVGEREEFLRQLPDWTIDLVDGEQRLTRSFRFKNFKLALAFSNKVGEIAEAEQHHPAILTEWGKVTISWWTHKLGGLHANDFIMAARTDRLFSAD